MLKSDISGTSLCEFQRCGRSRSRSASRSTYGSKEREEGSYVFPSSPRGRPASAPPLLGNISTQQFEHERGRTRTRISLVNRSGNSAYRYGDERPQKPICRASSVPSSSQKTPKAGICEVYTLILSPENLESIIGSQCINTIHSHGRYFLNFMHNLEISDDGSCDGNCDTPQSLGTNHGTSILSSLFSTRQAPLPKLGGMQSCGGCGNEVTYFESVMGPEGKRFHPRCLRCGDCGKDMESRSAYEFTKDRFMRFCCKNCTMEKSTVVVIHNDKPRKS
jgi:hypothetical protein